MLVTRRLHNDGVHASYQVYLKVRTIDRWLHTTLSVAASREARRASVSSVASSRPPLFSFFSSNFCACGYDAYDHQLSSQI